MSSIRSQIGIVGGGPAGLMLANELGYRGVECILFEEDTDTPWFPKANSSTSRTMEHYRRLGFAGEVRRTGLPADYPQDVAYFTRYTNGWELARLHGIPSFEAETRRYGAHDEWPTPEPVHRSNQIFIEPILKRHAEKWPSVSLMFGWKAVSVDLRADQVLVVAANEDGENREFTFRYLAGCDGPRSLIRTSLGISYEGVANEERVFMGGRMLASRIRAPALYDLIDSPQAWQYLAINAERRSILGALDGKGEFTFHTQLPQGAVTAHEWVEESLALTVQSDFEFQILDIVEWTAGLTLVASEFQRDGLVFLVGDAGHLFTPTGGLGYNTSIEDSANLGWKLAAVSLGWGGQKLLDSYEDERRPVALQNTKFAQTMADSMGRLPVTHEHEEDTPKGRALRAALSRDVSRHAEAEFNTQGIQFGVRYSSSPIVVQAEDIVTSWDPHSYQPDAIPGSRAPHVWITEDECIFDLLGPWFTLVRLDPILDVASFMSTANDMAVPIDLLDVENDEVNRLYAARIVLVRPDHHIAWRGDELPHDVQKLLRHVVGLPQLR